MRSALTLESEKIKKKVMGKLGFKDSELKPQERDRGLLTFDAIIRKGIPYAKVRLVTEALNLTDKEFADYLGINLRTLQRKRNSHEKLSIPEGDRLFRIARIFAFAVSVFESEEMARQWLHRAQIGLGERVPIQVIHTEAGALEVENLLGRIEYGVLA